MEPQTQRCRTPNKVPYASRSEAKRVARDGKNHSKFSAPGSLRPYLCDCGMWHLSKMSAAELRRNRKSARQKQEREQAYNAMIERAVERARQSKPPKVLVFEPGVAPRALANFPPASAMPEDTLATVGPRTYVVMDAKWQQVT